ncbi:enoyl-CoA hydratase domain-containing protein 2, mitochondrial [Cololabis saira]|uniref:enoyl-CoA hydratase domain-containing protein 2, mitochondrial n=1 Tax=Cololabis saira TaxID=129043 RepID=UPI002AD4E695|nr:enoyl-CoA hydratase domain-containing protein 2, mitochondrial [Cololabis saira]
MTALLGRLVVSGCSSWRCSRTGRAALPRAGARLLAGSERPLTGSGGADTPEPPQVDLKRLEGEDEGIVEVLMRRYRARNALGHVFVSQMGELVSSLSSDSAVRVVIFRSLVPGVFCAGADLKERSLMTDAESDLFVHGLRSLMTQIASLPSPTIAAMDGVALGGGLELALACDLRTATYSAQMGLIETTRGLLPGAGGSQRLPRMVGITLAKDLIFTGRRVGGRTALEMGLVNGAVEQNQAGDAAYREALSLAREILPQAPVAVRMAKEAMNRGMEVDIGSGMAIERMCYARVIPTRDRQEGMAAFIEKRPPQYTGE